MTCIMALSAALLPPAVCDPCAALEEDRAVLLLQEQYEPYVNREMERSETPGFCVAVVRSGKCVYVKSFGVADIDAPKPLTARSLFHMASVTKTFVACAVMQLRERGAIDLDAPVVRYVPYFRLKDARYRDITVRHMLTHTSGMPDVTDYQWGDPACDAGALERYVRSLENRPLIAAPGAEFHYSNMAFDVLGDVIAKVSGQPFESYVRDHVLVPLGMTHSTLLREEADGEFLTRPHIRKNGKVCVSPVFPYNRKHAPSSTLISDVSDMARWAAANLGRGELDGARILSAAAYDPLWQPGSATSPQIGLCWFLGDLDGRPCVYHGGNDVGFSSYLVLVPERSIGAVGISNFDKSPVAELTRSAIAILLKTGVERTQ